MNPQPAKWLNYRTAPSFVLLVVALAGWTAFAYAVRTSTELERRYEERLRSVTADRERVKVERDQWRRAHDTLYDVEKGFMAARQTYAVSQAMLSGELSAAREQVRQLAAQKNGYVAQLDAMRAEVTGLKRQLDESNRELLAQQSTNPQPSTKRTTSARAD